MEKVALWWDMDSCPLPSHMDPFVVRSMANILLQNVKLHGSGIHQFSAYKYPSAKDEDIELSQTFFNSGIQLQLVQPALAGNTNEIEKIIMADMLLWAMDVPPPGNIIFIVGNADFSYVFHKLRERSYNVFLVCASITQMPHGMLSVANECVEWLTFLQMLEQNEEKLQFPSNIYGWCPEHYQVSSNAYSMSASTDSTKEWEEYQNRSSFGYIPEDSFTGQSSFNNEQSSRQFSIPSLNEVATAVGQQPRRPGFHRHANKCTEKPMDPTVNSNRHRDWKPPILTGPKKMLASMDEFRSWLRQVVNSKENENGYNISPIRMDFEKATGKILAFSLLGFPKMMNLLEQCKDIAEVKEVRKGCHLAFPVKNNKQNLLKTKKPNPNPQPMKVKPENSLCGVNPYPDLQPQLNPNSNPKLEAGKQSMPKASGGDFYAFLLHMVSMGEFSQGFLMSKLPKTFESFSGKCLDIQHLGYKKLTNLVEVYSDLVSVDKTGAGPPRLYPAGFVREIIPNSNFSRTGEEFSVNMVDHVAEQEVKLEVNCSSTTGSDQSPDNMTWKDNISLENLSYQNSELAITENEWPSMDLNTLPLMGFQEYNKSDSSSTPQGSQFSEWDDQFSNTVSDLSIRANSHQLEGSACIKQSLSRLQSEGNIPIRNAAYVEALLNMRENKSICKEVTGVSETANSQDASCRTSFGGEVSNFVSSKSEQPFMELKVHSNVLVSPLQSLLPQESVVSTESLQDTRLDYKQPEQNAKGVVNEETNVHSIVSPAEAIMQVAGKGLKSLYDFSMWKKSP
ncbi:hypothetical protein SUGI_1068710 [Cryptomeria japonica]|uniref:uncharacterized protein LOC131073388 n=1 Tax=Cryptomeria japonica TaxID=3369 RepID=UPI002414BEC1|nr:uncharacterized protein LOC131073388 [Cryptomeria japonica]GLJ50211.1 hypothetical protein SUGI_1068710 [Cryptomeria japonica]